MIRYFPIAPLKWGEYIKGMPQARNSGFAVLSREFDMCMVVRACPQHLEA
jgi:hypothetical protein